MSIEEGGQRIAADQRGGVFHLAPLRHDVVCTTAIELVSFACRLGAAFKLS